MKKASIGFNFVALPQAIWDDAIELTLAEFRLIGYLARHYHRFENRRIDLTQDEILNGAKRKSGERYDKGCGISSGESLRNAREKLVDRGWIRVHKVGTEKKYEITYEFLLGKDELLDEMSQVGELPVTGSLPTHTQVVVLPADGSQTDLSNKEVEEALLEVEEEKPNHAVSEFLKKVDDLVLWAWSEYIRISRKNPKTYTLTKIRRDKCKTRVNELLKIYPDDFKSVASQFRYAMERLMESEFHREKGFIEWDKHLFRSQEQLERWINTPTKAGPNKPAKKSPWEKVQTQASGA